jgi:hypothetical protein
MVGKISQQCPPPLHRLEILYGQGCIQHMPHYRHNHVMHTVILANKMSHYIYSDHKTKI